MEECLLRAEKYEIQNKRWPSIGKHILAHYDEERILVYQAFKESIADYAIEHQHFGGPDYNPNRMTWIKPNFMWMMFRSDWAQSNGQERILGIWIKRTNFEKILSMAKSSSESNQPKQRSPTTCKIVVQWDPDHSVDKSKLDRRAIQIGLKNLKEWVSGEYIEKIVDMTPFVKYEYDKHVKDKDSPYDELMTPYEDIYTVSDELELNALVRPDPIM